jgi:predicted RNase H-like nuclease (RuvC/YqgF family)
VNGKKGLKMTPKTEKPHICKHNVLYRTCVYCEQEETIEQLEQELKEKDRLLALVQKGERLEIKDLTSKLAAAEQRVSFFKELSEHFEAGCKRLDSENQDLTSKLAAAEQRVKELKEKVTHAENVAWQRKKKINELNLKINYPSPDELDLTSKLAAAESKILFLTQYYNPKDTRFKNMIDTFVQLPKEKQDKLIKLAETLKDLNL